MMAETIWFLHQAVKCNKLSSLFRTITHSFHRQTDYTLHQLCHPPERLGL